MNAVIEKTMKSLERNNMKAYYAENRAQVCEIVKGMLFPGAVITAGGSVSLNESGVWDIISDPEYKFFNRLKPGISEEERLEIFRAAIGCDFFFCSSNAVTENGELINVDGNANRVAAYAYGPKHVLLIVGMNKVVKTEVDAMSRARNEAAPINAQRFGIDTPCSKNGTCFDCKSPQCICCQILTTRFSRVKGRFQIILVDENLGF